VGADNKYDNWEFSTTGSIQEDGIEVTSQKTIGRNRDGAETLGLIMISMKARDKLMAYHISI
jgi:hypothetical protein